MRHYDDPLLTYFKDLHQSGRDLQRKQPELYDTMVSSLSLDDVGVINYTSGTTGLPKGSMITHRNMIGVAKAQEAIDPTIEAFQYVSFLPFAWIGEQEFGVYWPLYRGFAVNFPEKVETVQENIREIAPHIMLAPPRIWEKICSDIQVKMQEAVWVKRWAYRWLLPVGYRMADFVLKKKNPPLFWRLLSIFAYFALFRSLKNHFGLTRLKHVYTGGAPLGPEIFKLFLALGIRIKQAYGTTELTAAAICHRSDDIQLDTVGKPLPGIEAAVSDNGELLIKGDTVFKGYYRNPEATAQSIRDGWFYTGDAALINDDGSVTIVDRLSDVMRLEEGGRFSPQLIENKLKFSQYIMDSVVIGQDKPFITAMIGIDFGNVGKWAENNKIPYTTFTDLSQKPEVYDLIAAEVQKTNESLPTVAKIKRFVLFYKELDADDEELTRTRKVRRKFIFERYRELIQALYEAADSLTVEADIRYQDGKKFRMKTQVLIKHVNAKE
jgi:long-chain acyl-CoA synthetase